MEQYNDAVLCQDQLFGDVFCTPEQCDTNCENYNATFIMAAVDNLKDQTGCRNIEICSKFLFHHFFNKF